MDNSEAKQTCDTSKWGFSGSLSPFIGSIWMYDEVWNSIEWVHNGLKWGGILSYTEIISFC